MPHAKKIDQVAISPDGTRVAYLVSGELAVTPTRRRLPTCNLGRGKLSLRELAWSADSQTSPASQIFPVTYPPPKFGSQRSTAARLSNMPN